LRQRGSDRGKNAGASDVKTEDYRSILILDFRVWILELRNSAYYKLIELHAAQAPALRERFHKSEIRNLKSQIMANDSFGIKAE